MSVLAEDQNQLTFIYNSETSLGKKAFATLQSSEHKIKSIDISKDSIADTIWVEVCKKLNKSIGEFCIEVDNGRNLADKDTSSFSDDDWIKMLNKQPEIVQKPVLIGKYESIIISNANDVLKSFNVDSAGLGKTLHYNEQVKSRTTKSEDFTK